MLSYPPTNVLKVLRSLGKSRKSQRSSRIGEEKVNRVLSEYLLDCRKWGWNKWGFRGCLAALPGNRLKSAFFALFLPFSPFSGRPEEHLENPQKTEEKGLFPQFSLDLLKPPSLKPPFAALQKFWCTSSGSGTLWAACRRVMHAWGVMLSGQLQGVFRCLCVCVFKVREFHTGPSFIHTLPENTLLKQGVAYKIPGEGGFKIPPPPSLKDALWAKKSGGGGGFCNTSPDLRHILGHLPVFSAVSNGCLCTIAISSHSRHNSGIARHSLQWPIFRHVAIWVDIQALSVNFGVSCQPAGALQKLSHFLSCSWLGTLGPAAVQATRARWGGVVQYSWCSADSEKGGSGGGVV